MPSRAHVRTSGAERARSPQRGPARLPEALLEGAGCRERLDLVDGRAGAAHEVFEIGERPFGSFVVDAVEQRVVQPAHAAQPEPHREV